MPRRPPKSPRTLSAFNFEIDPSPNDEDDEIAFDFGRPLPLSDIRHDSSLPLGLANREGH